MRCGNCGQSLAEGATSCPACGHAVLPPAGTGAFEGAIRDAAREVKGLTKAAVREARPIASAALKFTKGAIREAAQAARDAARELEGRPPAAPPGPPSGAVEESPRKRPPNQGDSGSGST